MNELQVKILKQVSIVGVGKYQETDEIICFDEKTVENNNLIERFAAKPDVIEVIGWTNTKTKKAKAKEKTNDVDESLGDGVELDK